MQISCANYLHLFIKAAAQVLAKREDAQFMIVGGGDQLDPAKELTQCEGTGEGLLFTGKVPHENIPDFIAAADIAVTCFEDNEQSRCKSSLNVVEYLASGKAIVASRLPEVERMIADGGILITLDQPNSIADAAINLLDNESLWVQLSVNAGKRAESIYNWSKSAETLQLAIEKAFWVHYGLN